MIGAGRWRQLRRTAQVVSAALFFLLAGLTYRGSQSILPSDLYFRLDPLAAFSAMVSSRAVLTTMLVASLMLALGFVVGRAWCGWLCPLGAILDWASPRRPGKVEPRPTWRAAKYILLLIILVAAVLGNLSFLVLDPITLLTRTFGGAFIPALNTLIVGSETFLYPLEPLQPPLEWFEANVRGTVLPVQQTYSQLGWSLSLIFASIVALNWLVPRFWCRYLCPLGAVYALEARFAWLRPRAVAECNHCADCIRVCPTGAISISKRGFAVEAAECTVCLNCMAQCSESVIEFKTSMSEATHTPLDLTRRQAAAGIAIGVAAVTLFHSAPSARRDDAFLIRPPGARENDLPSKCIRCAECVKVCPTGGLQAGLFESGLEGLWTPVLVPRLGYCDYACNACGQICPTQAIPRLSLAEKRTSVIGVAYIDTNRCIPWASYRPCIVCQEMCPLPDKAVKLEEVDVLAPDGSPVHLQRPRVEHALCIGCGICEYQCPLVGPAAIRVYAPTQLPG